MFALNRLSRPLLVVALLSSLPAAAQTRTTVAVAPLGSDSGPEYQWIGLAMANALAFRLQQIPELNGLTVRQVNAAMRHDRIAPSALLHQEPAFAVGRLLGADLLITGTFDAAWPNIEVVLNVWEPGHGKLRNTHIIQGTLDNLFALEGLAAGLLAKEIGIETLDTTPGAFGTLNIYAWRFTTLAQAITTWQSLAPRAADPRSPPKLREYQIKQAHHYLEEAVALDATFGEAWAALGVVEALAGRSGPALAAVNTALEHSQRFHPNAILAASFVRMRQGRVDGAVEVLEQAVAAHPGFLHARGYLGELYSLRGEHQKALDTFDAYHRIAPGQPWVLAQRGYSKSKLGDSAGAIADTEAALAIAPASVNLRIELASRRIDAGLLSAAGDLLRDIIAFNPDLAVAYTRLGYVHLLAGEDAQAIQLTEKAIGYGPSGQRHRDLAYAHLNLARAQGRAGKIDLAFVYLGRALELADVSIKDIETDPKLEGMRKDPRFRAIESRTGH